MIIGINHITLSVHDLPQSMTFYIETLGCKLLAKWDRGVYLLAGDLWLCLTLDHKTRDSALPEYTHFAFNVSSENFSTIAEKIKKAGITIFKENTSEGDSLYFLDPNGHKLEIHTSDWRARIAACKKAPYSGMEFFI